MLKRLSEIKAFLELMRPFTLLAPAVGFFCAGIIAWSKPPRINFISESLIFLIVGSLSAVLLNAASNSLNQYFDIVIDEINKPKRPLPSGRLNKTQVAMFASALYLSSLILAWFVSPQGRHQCFVIVLMAAFLTHSYSAPPLRAKRFTFLSNITIALPRGMLLVVAGWSAIKSINSIEPWAIGSVFFFFLLGAASTKDFSDIQGDAKYHCRTLPVKYGSAKSARTIAPFLVLPWLTILPLSYFKIITGSLKTLTISSLLLSGWGLYIAWLLISNSEKLETKQNHISWQHMYLLMMTAYAGITLAYLIK